MAYALGLKTIAANDDRLKTFTASTMTELRANLLARAPYFDYFVYYRHAPVGRYFRLYDGLSREHLIFNRPYLSRAEGEQAWDAVLMMAHIERTAKIRLQGRNITPEIVKRYPKIETVRSFSIID